MKTKWNKYPPFSVAVQTLSLAALLMVVSCADKDLPDEGNSQEEQGMEMTFDVRDVQDAPEADVETGNPETRAGKAKSAYPIEKIDVEDGDSLGLCLIETTVDGVNPVKRDSNEVITRGTVKTAIDADFGMHAWRNNTNNWYFHNERVRPNGRLYKTYRWRDGIGSLQFEAYYPYSTGTGTNADIVPTGGYIDFTVNPSVSAQKDLMLALSNVITYDDSGVAPAVPLQFSHWLTAVKFAVGDNLSWNWTINKIEIVGACGKGRFQYGVGWGGQNTPQTFTLDGVNLSTAKAVNSEITGPNHTFLMLPQQLTGRGVKAKIYFTNGKAITATLKGEWVPGTTKTYKLSNSSTSNWDWQLTVSSPAVVPYNSNVAGAYGITSYRRSTDGTVQPVPWTVTGYYYDNAWKATPPAWLTGLTKPNGNGGTAAEQGVATVRVDYLADKVTWRNNQLKNAPAKGTAAAPYDLSLHDIKGNTTARNTANSYIISAPGYYTLPLVYGNAIKNGVENTNAYISQSTSTSDQLMRNFHDAFAQAINNPWIVARYRPVGVYVVWADETNLVSNPAVSADGYSLTFQVTQAQMRQGNVVLAVTDAWNNTLWSYHLWFAPDDVLDKIPVAGGDYTRYFTKETLGWKYTAWSATTYETTRSVGVAVMQTTGPKKSAVIWISQDPATTYIRGYATLYQFGRKDAFPSINPMEGSINSSGRPVDIWKHIRFPRSFFLQSDNNGIEDWEPANRKNNYWSANDPAQDGPYSPTVVKTVYDPTPVGCKVPPVGSFQCFTLGKVVGGNGEARFNAIQGFEFSAPASPTGKLYFPTTGYRASGNMGYGGRMTHFWLWTANANYRHSGTCMWGMRDQMRTWSIVARGMGIGVRPVAE